MKQHVGETARVSPTCCASISVEETLAVSLRLLQGNDAQTTDVQLDHCTP